ncbi:MAG: hypothetical protein ACP5J8_00295 [Minisyncoccia bacterium]
MTKNNKKKVIDIIPPKDKKTKAEPIDKTPKEESEEVFVKIKSQTTQFELPEEKINESNKKINPFKEKEKLEETGEKKEYPDTSDDLSRETKDKTEKENFIDKDSFFKKLEEELKLQNKETESLLFTEKTEKTEKIITQKHLIKKVVLSLIGFILGIGLFYYLGFIILPKAEINITAKKLKITNDNFVVLVDAMANQININNKVIPGNTFTFTETVSKDFNSTGRGKDERSAKGKIVIINNFSTSPQILIATTRFEHPSGKIYRLDSRIVVPGAILENGKLKPSSIEATITADQPGPEYNIDPCNSNNNCKFTIPAFKGTNKYNGFYAISNEPITGGGTGANPMITNQDIKNAEDTVLSEINEKIQQDIKNKIPANLKIINTAQSSLKINKITSSGNAGDYRQTFTETISGEVDVLAFKEDDLINLIKNIFNKDKPDKYDYCSTPQIEYKDAVVNFKNNQLKLTISYVLPICYSLDPNEIKNAIKGKPEKELGLILKSFDGIESVKIKLYPFWVRKVPTRDNRIKIVID